MVWCLVKHRDKFSFITVRKKTIGAVRGTADSDYSPGILSHFLAVMHKPRDTDRSKRIERHGRVVALRPKGVNVATWFLVHVPHFTVFNHNKLWKIDRICYMH
jgi:hypothetical protein